MNLFKKILHYWLAIVSFFSFLVGWVMLAHSIKPIQPTESSAPSLIPLPTLPPIQTFGNENNSGNGLDLTIPMNQPNLGFPRLRTGGS
jgi:hypothetical protein